MHEPTRQQLHAQVARFIADCAEGRGDPATRDRLLCKVMAWQAAHVSAYARLVARCPPRDRHDPSCWPAVPTEVFRYARVAAHASSEDVRVFRTSGTTQPLRGSHALRSLDLYDLAARSAGSRMLFPDLATQSDAAQRMRLIIMAPPSEALADSSLSYMLSRFVEWFGDPHSEHVWRDAELDAAALAHALDRACAAGAPVALLGTSFAFVHAEDAFDASQPSAPTWVLPPGSRIMQTGGFKGRSREVTPEAMLDLLQARYGVPRDRIVQEYGMTELSSQLYEDKLVASHATSAFWVPGWLRVSLIDPQTGAPTTGTDPGLVRIEDLANLDTACAIQTADLGRWHGDRLQVLGRAADATPRGCSLAVDDALSQRAQPTLGSSPAPRGATPARTPRSATPATTTGERALEEAAQQLRAGAAAQRAMGTLRIATALAGAARILGDPDTSLGASLRRTLEDQQVASRAMIAWGLDTSLGSVRVEALRDLAAALVRENAVAVPSRLTVVVLAGNVFSAAFRALALPLLSGAPVLAKATLRDDAMAVHFAQALHAVDAEVGAGLRVCSVDRQHISARAAWWSLADMVSVYGSDATVEAIAADLPARVSLLPHGHGAGALYVPRAVQDGAEAQVWLKRAALDIAAYDQRGCMSPQVILLEATSTDQAERWARRLCTDALAHWAQALPRAPLSAGEAAAQMQWRAVAASQGSLFEDTFHAVSVESTWPPRPAPGLRHISVVPCRDVDEAVRALADFGVHLKALGIAGDRAMRAEVVQALPPPLSGRVCPAGSMQTPPLHAYADGQPPMQGLVRWLQPELHADE